MITFEHLTTSTICVSSWKKTVWQRVKAYSRRRRSPPLLEYLRVDKTVSGTFCFALWIERYHIKEGASISTVTLEASSSWRLSIKQGFLLGLSIEQGFLLQAFLLDTI
jgi:hypothetical protein